MTSVVNVRRHSSALLNKVQVHQVIIRVRKASSAHKVVGLLSRALQEVINRLKVK